MKRVEIDNTKNLDLNTTARKNEKTMEKFSPYLNLSTYAVIISNLSYPIGSFDEAKELAILAQTASEAELLAQQQPDSRGKGTTTPDTMKGKKGDSKKDLNKDKSGSKKVVE